jgi:type I restriction enzyme M protein
VQAVNPTLGETVLDPAAGTGGFLVEVFEHLRTTCETVDDLEALQRRTLFGTEAKSLPFLLCQMNLVLHGVETPSIDPLNALRGKLSEIGDRDRFDVIVTNPPFGGEEERGIQRNFPEDKQTAETSLLFLQLIMRKLRRPGHSGRAGGRAGVVVPNGTLSGDGVAARIKQELLDGYNLHTIVRLPNGVFSPYTPIPTNVMFFDRSGPTREIWYYDHPLPDGRKNYTKTIPLKFDEFEPMFQWWNDRTETDRAWNVSADVVRDDLYNLDRQNPNAVEQIDTRSPGEIADAIATTEARIAELVREVRDVVRSWE